MTVRTVLCVDTGDAVGTVADAIDDTDTLSAVTATSVAAAADVLAGESVDCVVTEYDLPDGTGLDVVATIRAEQPQTPCVLFTDASPTEIETESFEDLVVEYLTKDLPDAYERLGFVVDDVITHSAQVGFLVPDDERSRLAALAEYDVEALPIEESFTRLTDLMADHFDVPVAFVGLLEQDRERFLACHGADWGSLTREDTICTHSMLQDDVMVVEDVREDGRFSENETLRDLGIRSYAGANMTTPDGQVIGQVCLIDHEPRSYDAAERERLQQFAETAMEILELRQQLLEARDEVPA